MIGPAVDILSPDLAGNATGRALVLADLLAPRHRVRLIGPASGEVWLPLRSGPHREVVVAGPVGWSSVRRVASLITAPAVIAVKPLLTSFGPALLTRRGRRVILDIDDPEVALLTSDWRAVVSTWWGPMGIMPTLASAALGRFADAITVAGGQLQADHGGVVIPHARDGRLFADNRVRDRQLARSELGLDAAGPLVAFVGTPRGHKGVDILGSIAQAIAPATVVVVGAGARDTIPALVKNVPPVDYATAMRWVAAADVVLVPQRPGRIAAKQVPAKLTDALAVGRAIVATDLPPIRDVVDEAGLLVDHEAESYVGAIHRVLGDEALKSSLERAARARFLEQFSFDAVAPRLEGVVSPGS